MRELLWLNLIEINLLGAVFILSIIFFRALIRNFLPQKVFMLLWYLAIVRLLLPVSILWESGHQTILEETKQAVPELTNQLWQGTLLLVTSSPTVEYSNPNPVISIYFVLKCLWLLGMFFVGIYFILSYRSCKKNFRESLPVQNKKILDMVEESILSKPLMHFRSIRVRSFDQIRSPLTYGIFHPVIVLPKNLLTDLEEETSCNALKIMIIHECIHIKRMDALTKILLAAVLTIYWFNPFVWLLYILANRDIELVCDETVIKYLGESRRTFYASLLLHMEAERSSLSIYNHFSKNILEERITEIMKRKRITILSSLCAVLFIFCAVFTAFAKNAETTPIQTETTPAIDKEPSNSNTPSKAPEETIEPTSPTTYGAEIIDNQETTENTSYIWVSNECYSITSTFGERIHPITGQKSTLDHITIGGVDGAEILATAAGTVEETGFETEKGWGNYIVLNHGNGLCTMYTHCKEILVKTDDIVKQGDVIATMGKTGKATGVCLGFYVYKDGIPQDPENYLPQTQN